jgi:hypothetical protein
MIHISSSPSFVRAQGIRPRCTVTCRPSHILLFTTIFRNLTAVAGRVLFWVVATPMQSASNGGKYCVPRATVHTIEYCEPRATVHTLKYCVPRTTVHTIEYCEPRATVHTIKYCAPRANIHTIKYCVPRATVRTIKYCAPRATVQIGRASGRERVLLRV